jgi:5-(carboxyamino)imidazole ribonucleotide mutase
LEAPRTSRHALKKTVEYRPQGFIEHLQRRPSARHSLFGDLSFVGAQQAAPFYGCRALKRLANRMKTKGKRLAGDGKGVITYPLVGIIMGSGSDWDTMKFAVQTLKALGVPHETRVVSAHRTPDLLFEYASGAEKRGIQVIIAGAGGAAHLPGMTASKTVLPVLGVPVESKALKGLDSLLSIAQMPRGVPVGTLAIGRSGAVNAALLAAAILGVKLPAVRSALRKFRDDQTGLVLAHPDPSAAPPPAKKKGKRA